MSKIIDFYNLEPNDDGLSLFNIWDFTNDELENCHNYIQWLFPTTEPSLFHPEVPILTQEDINIFKVNSPHNEKPARVIISLMRILDFFWTKIFARKK